MKVRPDPTPAAGLPLARFLERIRCSFSHDLRTPLGTIVNYAAVLEATPGVDSVEVRDLGRRIRDNAQRVSRMVQLLATATGLASRPWQTTTTDLVVLAQSVVTDLGGRGRVRLAPNMSTALVDVDAEILGFAWRAYAAVEHGTRARSVDECELLLEKGFQDVRVELRCGPPNPVATGSQTLETDLELTEFLRHNGGPDRLESAMGLKLAEDLVISLGGELRVWGRPGVRSGLRFRFPAAA